MPDSDPQRSPLHEEHLRLGGRIVPFAGWEMPVQYEGIIAEHQAVRSTCGVFDISHMGQVFVSGPDCPAWLDHMLTGRMSEMAVDSALYTLLLNENGGVIDDLIAYRLDAEDYLLIVNASMIDEDVNWLCAHLIDGVILDDRSAEHAAIALQGPDAGSIAEKMLADSGASMPTHNAVVRFSTDAGTVFLCGTGYTGESGFELVCPVADGTRWFNAALEAGATPCGLGARDSLRLEMGYPLNGSDLSAERTPLQAGLGFFVALDKPDFIGREALLKQKQEGLGSRLVAIEMTAKGPPPRPHYQIFSGDECLGELSSGGLSPSLGKGIGMAYLPTKFCKIDTPLELDIRGKRFAAKVVKKPFYRTKK